MSATTELLQEGRYRIDATIAETSESAVFQGYDTVRNAKVVVKEIVVKMNKVTTLAQQENLKLNFVNQAKILATVKHDSLVQVEDYFSEIGRQFLVLESVDGDDLESAVKANGKGFSVKEVAAWADQILDALKYLHALEPPLIHKFVRPKNIRKLPDGRVKLLAHGMHSSDGSVSTSIAPGGDDAGVLNFSALEIIWEGLDSASQKVIASGYDEQSEKILKSAPDARSDVYSVGATLYFILTGKAPVDPLERSIEMLDGKADPLAKPSELNPEIPEQVNDAIVKALMIKREDRHDSASAMRIALRAAMVRAQEGPNAEERELEEAAETLRMAEKARQDQIQKAAMQKAAQQKPVEQKAAEQEDEKRRNEELLQQKLREAEELRLAAEQRAAEAERLLKQEEAKKEAAEAALHSSQPTVEVGPEEDILEDSLLELSVAPNRELSPAVQEAEVVAFEDIQPAEVVKHEASKKGKKAKAEPKVEETRTVEPAVTETKYDDIDAFSYEETKSGSKMPLIAGAAAVLLLVVIGGWMMLGSSEQPTATQPAASQPAAPAHEQPAQTETSPAQAATADPAAEQPAAAADPAQTRTAAKPTPAKTPKPNAEAAKTPEKKKVTVDDLINDN